MSGGFLNLQIGQNIMVELDHIWILLNFVAGCQLIDDFLNPPLSHYRCVWCVSFVNAKSLGDYFHLGHTKNLLQLCWFLKLSILNLRVFLYYITNVSLWPRSHFTIFFESLVKRSMGFLCQLSVSDCLRYVGMVFQ